MHSLDGLALLRMDFGQGVAVDDQLTCRCSRSQLQQSPVLYKLKPGSSCTWQAVSSAHVSGTVHGQETELGKFTTAIAHILGRGDGQI